MNQYLFATILLSLYAASALTEPATDRQPAPGIHQETPVETVVVQDSLSEQALVELTGWSDELPQ